MMTIDETRLLAERMALSASPSRRVFGLVGDLGSGKTSFSSFFLKALGVTGPTPSPTFVIMRNYPLPGRPFSAAYHIDCYRLKSPEELISLGFGDAARDPRAIILVEWADMVRSIMPADAVWIDFSHTDRPERRTIAPRDPIP